MSSAPITARRQRCVIYTRKSSEHGLEQAFNSLDNQREAAEAYIKSQAHEGWCLLPDTYDDGGFSGGSLDRPALQRLLAVAKAGGIDVIVVYKVDRLTRSLADFAKLVELFDAHGVSFVSVTQAFNTTTSMGRLTLNVLLSFAQFEREITGERIRDKIAASKRKGLRVGGPVPLGYVVKDKRLVPCPTEAAQVDTIFRRYLEIGSLTGLMQDLAERGILTKITPRRDGTVRGGIAFHKGGLAALLKNRCYIGEVVHKGRHYPGEHAPIVPNDLFQAVQEALTARTRRRAKTGLNSGSLLKGLLFDANGNRMTPSMAKKNGAYYRYYVSCCLNQGRRADAPMRSRVAAPDIEARVLEALKLDAPATSIAAGTDIGSAVMNQTDHLAQCLRDRVRRIALLEDAIEIAFHSAPTGTPAPLILPWTHSSPRRQRQVIAASEGADARPLRAETRARLVQGIANARLWLDELVTGEMPDIKAIALREVCSERQVRLTLNLAFLAPTIVKAAVEGTLPEGHGVVQCTTMPIVWGR